MLPIILCLFEGLNDLRLVYNDCEKNYFITFVKVGVAIYNDHTVIGGKLVYGLDHWKRNWVKMSVRNAGNTLGHVRNAEL